MYRYLIPHFPSAILFRQGRVASERMESDLNPVWDPHFAPAFCKTHVSPLFAAGGDYGPNKQSVCMLFALIHAYNIQD